MGREGKSRVMVEFLDWQVRDVMSKPVTIGPDANLAEAQSLLEGHGFDALPVVDAGDRLLGWLSSLDLLTAFAVGEDAVLVPYDEIMRRAVSTAMSRDVTTVCRRTPLTRMIDKIADTRIRSFPVIEDDRLVGVVSRADVMSAVRRACAGELPGG